MFTVKRLPEFDAWMASLRDGMTKRRLAVRLRKAQLGNLGDGDKSSQATDIATAIRLANQLEG